MQVYNMHRIFLIQYVIMCRYFLEKVTRPTLLNTLWGCFGKREISSVLCEHARINDGENPEVTIPKSECEFRSVKSEVWSLMSEDTSRFPYTTTRGSKRFFLILIGIYSIKLRQPWINVREYRKVNQKFEINSVKKILDINKQIRVGSTRNTKAIHDGNLCA
jgi:hypothetical protein